MSGIKNLQWDNRETGDTALRQMQLVELRLLRIVDYICQKHKIKYVLIAGTLLGAVRHGGFIPWDDDIDIWMQDDDYRKFQEVAQEELPADVFLQSRSSDANHILPWLKLRDAYSSAYTDESDYENGLHIGISLDILPFSSYPSCSRFIKFMHHVNLVVDWVAHPCRGSSSWVHVARIPCMLLCKMFELFWWFIRHCRETRFYSISPNRGGSGVDLFIRPEDIFPLKKIGFEGYLFDGPANPDAILKADFGDYMQLPPVEKRRCHEKNIHPFTPCKHPRAMPWPVDRKSSPEK